MDCRETLLLISPYLDGELNGNKLAGFLEHTAGCKTCSYELLLQENICRTLKSMNSPIQVPPELCGMVMNGVARQRRGFLRVLSPRLQRTIAVAATVLIMAGGSAGLTAAALKTDIGSKVVAHFSAPTVTTKPEQNTTPLPEGDGSGAINQSVPSATTGENSSPAVPDKGNETGVTPPSGANNEGPREIASTGTKNNSGALGTTAPSVVDGPREFFNTEVKLNSTIMIISVGELDRAKSRAVSLAIDSGAAAHVYPEQSNGKNMLYMRLTVAPDQASKLIDGLNGLGVLVDRQDESKDITSIYNETWVNYNSLQYQTSIEQDDTARQQLEAKASSYKQQLDTWTEEADNRVINLWLESNN